MGVLVEVVVEVEVELEVELLEPGTQHWISPPMHGHSCILFVSFPAW